MLKVEQALAHILAGAPDLHDDHDSEFIDLYRVQKRVLAEDVVATTDVPPADNSAMDGYAVRMADIKNLDITTGLTLPLSQRIAAGDRVNALAPNSAARLFTGSEIPAGADAVVIQEDCLQPSADKVTIRKAPKVGDNIRRRGQDIQNNSRIAEKGSPITASLTGLMASVGIAQVKVWRPLKVALLATGNELVEPGQALLAGQIYNSNQAMLHHWLVSMGCEIVTREIVKDSLPATIDAMRACNESADLIISSGGVSVGEEDHVKTAMQTLGELQLWKVAMKPGKPLAFGKLSKAMFLGLPGNPVSAFVTFMVFGQPLVRKMRGETCKATATTFIPANFSCKAQSRREFCRVQIVDGKLEKFPNQSSAVLSSVCWADALACIPENTAIQVGDALEVLPFDAFES